MKKMIMMLVVIMAGLTAAQAKDIYSRNESDLPQAARTVIKKNFRSKVSLIKIDKDWGRVSDYDVTLSDGTKIDFDNAGNWKEVETGMNGAVPSYFVPKNVSGFVSSNQTGTHIVGIEKDRKGYEVTLSNGVEMKFDTSGNFLKYD